MRRIDARFWEYARRVIGLDRIAILILFAVLVVLAIGCLLGTITPRSRDISAFTKCENKLTRIAYALEDYRRDHGTYPPPFVADSTGMSRHSWRVLLLPYLDCRPMYELYDFAQPWNGPKNAYIAQCTLEIFQCLGDVDDGKSGEHSNYLAVAGSLADLDGSRDRSLGTPRDGPRKRVVLVEVANSDVHWMEPRDLARDELLRVLIPDSGEGVRRGHKRGLNVLVSSGRAGDRLRVETLTGETGEETLRRLLSP